MRDINLLIVDDDKEILDLLKIYLTNEGYNVFYVSSVTDAYKILEENSMQLIILDLMMPEIDGTQACIDIRKSSNIPIIILSAKSSDMDKIVGLSIGADDYITKPFNPLELIARIKSQLRRYLILSPQKSDETQREVIDINGLVIDAENHTVVLYDRPINLTPTEFDILHLLASNLGKVFSAEDIFKQVWQENYFDSNNTVMVHIRKIREKMEDNSKNPRFIKTIWGVGYKIEK